MLRMWTGLKEGLQPSSGGRLAAAQPEQSDAWRQTECQSRFSAVKQAQKELSKATNKARNDAAKEEEPGQKKSRAKARAEVNENAAALEECEPKVGIEAWHLCPKTLLK